MSKERDAGVIGAVGAGVGEPTMVQHILQAGAFLTVVPLPGRHIRGFAPGSVAYFPAIGLAMGMTLVLADRVLAVFPLPLRSILLIAAWLVLTGALHLDGWIDACDALAPGLTRERALGALRDPRAGAMGVAGGFVLLATKWAALSSVASGRGRWLILAVVCARWGVTMLLVISNPAAEPGLGGSLARRVGWRHALLPIATLAAMWPFVAPLAWVGAVVATVAVCVVLSLTLRRRIGDLTGDGYGAVVELSETVVLLLGAAGTSS